MVEMGIIIDAWYDIGERLEERGEECDYSSRGVSKQEWFVRLRDVFTANVLREKQMSYNGMNVRVLLEAINQLQHLLATTCGNRAVKEKCRKRIKAFRGEAERKGGLGIGASQVEDVEQNLGREKRTWHNVLEGSVQQKSEPINVRGTNAYVKGLRDVQFEYTWQRYGSLHTYFRAETHVGVDSACRCVIEKFTIHPINIPLRRKIAD